MSHFVRPAEWLRNLFTSSRTEFQNPDRLSNDVSLVHPYDGGAWGIEIPEQWIKSTQSAAGVSSTTTIYTVPEDHIFRLWGVGIEWKAGNAPVDFYAFCQIARGGVNIRSGLTEIVQPNLAAIGAVDHPIGLPLTCPNGVILPPRMIVRGYFEGGSAASRVDWTLYGTEVPLGACPMV